MVVDLGGDGGRPMRCGMAVRSPTEVGVMDGTVPGWRWTSSWRRIQRDTTRSMGGGGCVGPAELVAGVGSRCVGGGSRWMQRGGDGWGWGWD